MWKIYLVGCIALGFLLSGCERDFWGGPSVGPGEAGYEYYGGSGQLGPDYPYGGYYYPNGTYIQGEHEGYYKKLPPRPRKYRVTAKDQKKYDNLNARIQKRIAKVKQNPAVTHKEVETKPKSNLIAAPESNTQRAKSTVPAKKATSNEQEPFGY